MYNNNFNEEMENELKELNLGGKCISISDNDKGTPNDYANLESKEDKKTEANREVMEKSISYAEASLPVGCELNSKTKENISNTLLNTLGLSYDEFDKLDFDEQQKIIRQYHKKNSKSKDKSSFVMIGNGEHSTFIRVKNGEKVMIGSGEHSCFVEAGLTPEEERIKLDDKLDDVIYSKPIALAKKIVRRIKKN